MACLLSDKRALSCGFPSTGEPVLTAQWRKTAGDNNAPIVSHLLVANGTCDPALGRKSKLSEGGSTTICKPDGDRPLIAIIKTTERGDCSATYHAPRSTRTITGDMILTQPTVIRDDYIVFDTNAKIVTNGHDLDIVAKKEMDLNGTTQIISFEEGSQGAPGRHAGRVSVQTPLLRGDRLIITNHGENGAHGNVGAPGLAGGDAKLGKRLKGCGGGHDGRMGGVGGKGESGAPGGNGGSVILSVGTGYKDGVVERISVRKIQRLWDGPFRPCKGNCGGLGGNGGQGGPGGEGGRGKGRNDVCPSKQAGPRGPVGATGDKGPDGEEGTTTII